MNEEENLELENDLENTEFLEDFTEFNELENENISYAGSEEENYDENSMVIEEEIKHEEKNINNNQDKLNSKDILLPNKWTPLPSDKWISAKPIQFKEDFIKNIPENVKTPYDFFRLFFDDSYNKQLASFTNKYAAYRKKNYLQNKKDIPHDYPDSKITREENFRKNEIQLALKWKDIDETDIEKFITSYIIFGLYKLPTLEDHFSPSSLIKSPALELTTSWKNKIMSSFFHAAEVETKSKDKIIPAIKHIINISQKYYYPSTGVSIDERMVSYKGRSDYLYYCQSKPTKWGFKPYVLSDFKSGYTYGMNVLENIETKNNSKEDGKMYNLVKNLMSELKENNKDNYSPHILATDGLYTSEKLLLEKDFKFIGAIRPSRIRMKHNKEIIKEINKGTFKYYYKYEEGDFQVLTKYMDSKLLFLVSNFVDTNKLCTKIRWSKKLHQFIEISFPEIVKIYQIFMKGVDISNQLISYYEIDMRMRKWWKRLFNHLIDIAVVNSFILYNKSGKGELLSQKNFREAIVMAVIAKYKVEQISKEIACQHLIKKINKQKMCKGCAEKKYYNAKKVPTTPFICVACGEHVCPNCFYDYHQNRIKKNKRY